MSGPLRSETWAEHAADGARRFCRRTPEAQADIAAARAAPTELEREAQRQDPALAVHPRELPKCAHAMYQPDCRGCNAEVTADLDAALSNAAIADTPAVRGMGGPTRRIPMTPLEIAREMVAYADHQHAERGAPESEADCVARELLRIVGQTPPPDAIVLTGPEAERYRAITDAARKAQASAATARADGAALLQLFQAFCAGIAPEGKP